MFWAPSRSHYLAISLGVAYGISLRVLLGADAQIARDVFAFDGLVSFSFFVLVPLAIGFTTTFLADSRLARSTKWATFGPWIAIFFFLATSVLLLLEGSICVAIALPAFLVLSSLGGLLALWIARLRARRPGTLCVVLVIPLVSSPIERMIPVPSHVDAVESAIRIEAPADAVWAQIIDVGLIDENELAMGLTRLMGMPRPLEAHMHVSDSGLVRNTRWAGGVQFRELITDSSEHEYLSWVFDFPPSAIPEGVLDEHVLIGGEYFELLAGGYRLDPHPDGSTLLTLRTSYRVSARPSLYSRLWAHVVLADFHRIILRLMRDRSEMEAA